MTNYEKTFKEIKKLVEDNANIFNLPNNYKNSNGYFPGFLKELLDNYEKFFKDKLNAIINEKIPFLDNQKDVILNKIKKLNKIILDTLDFYYAGKPFKANQIFTQGLEEAFLKDIQYETEIPKGKNFYRARPDNGKFFESKDLFHIDFKLRTLVSTNRYSIPGFPSLYLGDSSYVCWEEFGKPKFRNLWFSRLQNKENIKIIEILLVDDFLQKIEQEIDKGFKFTYILRYLVYFPLTLASTIKVKNSEDNFKPEYIIPQMLLEYVIGNPEIDGIKFPSTKVNYSSLTKIDSYNYVFPVKTNKKEGLCDRLKSLFELTHPTSLEMEELLNNPAHAPTYLYGGQLEPEKKIEITGEKELYYYNTSFGKIEYILGNKKLKVL
ncbi:hypothetical protein [Seonamhaeicola maritimus]|uniref:RES family NAD+ phosphorylase n=1 Tax=Seonamhaeicola maritimus TaxID=2591822 RepID=A0A5C7GI47_9FLAO|nr:hypothetical protein [Seonamhaeicola maritimus]TXG36981.1 hypothetical protein FUA22_10445 [Seonamhaeicola maritimus]